MPIEVLRQLGQSKEGQKMIRSLGAAIVCCLQIDEHVNDSKVAQTVSAKLSKLLGIPPKEADTRLSMVDTIDQHNKEMIHLHRHTMAKAAKNESLQKHIDDLAAAIQSNKNHKATIESLEKVIQALDAMKDSFLIDNMTGIIGEHLGALVAPPFSLLVVVGVEMMKSFILSSAKGIVTVKKQDKEMLAEKSLLEATESVKNALLAEIKVVKTEGGMIKESAVADYVKTLEHYIATQGDVGSLRKAIIDHELHIIQLGVDGFGKSDNVKTRYRFLKGEIACLKRTTKSNQVMDSFSHHHAEHDRPLELQIELYSMEVEIIEKSGILTADQMKEQVLAVAKDQYAILNKEIKDIQNRLVDEKDPVKQALIKADLSELKKLYSSSKAIDAHKKTKDGLIKKTVVFKIKRKVGKLSVQDKHRSLFKKHISERIIESEEKHQKSRSEIFQEEADQVEISDEVLVNVISAKERLVTLGKERDAIAAELPVDVLATPMESEAPSLHDPKAQRQQRVTEDKRSLSTGRRFTMIGALSRQPSEHARKQEMGSPVSFKENIAPSL